MADRYAQHTIMVMNGGDPLNSRAEIADMAAGFMADIPDLVLTLDSVLAADRHMIYAWTLQGQHVKTGNRIHFSGWEEWDLDDNLKVTKSLGWYDAADYERQVSRF